MSSDEKEYTPESVQGVLKELAQNVLELGVVDWNDLAQQDDTPNIMAERVMTLVNGAGMLGNLAMAAMVPLVTVYDGMVAAAIGAADSTQGDGQ